MQISNEDLAALHDIMTKVKSDAQVVDVDALAGAINQSAYQILQEFQQLEDCLTSYPNFSDEQWEWIATQFLPEHALGINDVITSWELEINKIEHTVELFKENVEILKQEHTRCNRMISSFHESKGIPAAQKEGASD